MLVCVCRLPLRRRAQQAAVASFLYASALLVCRRDSAILREVRVLTSHTTCCVAARCVCPLRAVLLVSDGAFVPAHRLLLPRSCAQTTRLPLAIRCCLPFAEVCFCVCVYGVWLELLPFAVRCYICGAAASTALCVAAGALWLRENGLLPLLSPATQDMLLHRCGGHEGSRHRHRLLRCSLLRSRRCALSSIRCVVFVTH